MVFEAKIQQKINAYRQTHPKVKMLDEQILSILVVGRVQQYSLNTTLKFMYLSCWKTIVQHDLRLNNQIICSFTFVF